MGCIALDAVGEIESGESDCAAQAGEVHSVQYLESFAHDMAKEAIGMRGGLRHLAKSAPG